MTLRARLMRLLERVEPTPLPQPGLSAETKRKLHLAGLLGRLDRGQPRQHLIDWRAMSKRKLG